MHFKRNLDCLFDLWESAVEQKDILSHLLLGDSTGEKEKKYVGQENKSWDPLGMTILSYLGLLRSCTFMGSYCSCVESDVAGLESIMLMIPLRSKRVHS